MNMLEGEEEGVEKVMHEKRKGGNFSEDTRFCTDAHCNFHG